ncbi:hypothetical protein BC826DRAFT_973607, partial [Russula brevipes]
MTTVASIRGTVPSWMGAVWLQGFCIPWGLGGERYVLVGGGGGGGGGSGCCRGGGCCDCGALNAGSGTGQSSYIPYSGLFASGMQGMTRCGHGGRARLLLVGGAVVPAPLEVDAT